MIQVMFHFYENIFTGVGVFFHTYPLAIVVALSIAAVVLTIIAVRQQKKENKEEQA